VHPGEVVEVALREAGQVLAALAEVLEALIEGRDETPDGARELALGVERDGAHHVVDVEGVLRAVDAGEVPGGLDVAGEGAVDADAAAEDDEAELVDQLVAGVAVALLAAGVGDELGDLVEDVVEVVVDELAGEAVHPVAGVAHDGRAEGAGEVVAVEALDVDGGAERAVAHQLAHGEGRGVEEVAVADGELLVGAGGERDEL